MNKLMIRKVAKSIQGEYRASDVAKALKKATGKDYNRGAISNILVASQGVYHSKEAVDTVRGRHYQRIVFNNERGEQQ